MLRKSTCFLILASVTISLSFPLQCSNTRAVKLRSTTSLTRLYAFEQNERKTRKKKSEPVVSSWLEEFQTAKGSIVDPYKVLRVPRTATKAEIKQSYRKLSRKLHPDMVANRDILPGNCANLEEVREEWEKVKLSYEILTDKKMRQKYDRHATVADPGAALGRAAMSAVGWGLSSVWKAGQNAMKAGVSSAVSVEGAKDQ